MKRLTSPAISPAVRDIGGEICSAIFSSFAILMVFDVLRMATPVNVMMWTLVVSAFARFLRWQEGNEFIVTRGAARRDVFLRRVLPRFAIWPAGILFLLILPQFQHRQDYPLFFLAMTAGFMISASATAFFRTKAMLPIIGFATMLFVSMIILNSLQRDHLPSLPETIAGSLIMATIASLLLVVAYRRFLKMEVV